MLLRDFHPIGFKIRITPINQNHTIIYLREMGGSTFLILVSNFSKQMKKIQFTLLVFLISMAAAIATRACNTPANLHFVQSGAVTQLLWDAVPGATAYIVEIGDPFYPDPFDPRYSWSATIYQNDYEIPFNIQAYPLFWRVTSICPAGQAVSNVENISIPCMTPSNPVASNTTHTSTDLSWSLNAVPGEAYPWQLAYRVLGSNTWIPLSFGGSSITYQNLVTLNNLQAGTTYEWCVNQYCPFTATYSDPLIGLFTTLSAVCPTATVQSATNITSGSATLQWSSVQGATQYQVQWFFNNAVTPTGTTTTISNSYLLQNIPPQTLVQYRVAAICPFAPGSALNFSSFSSFTTPALPSTNDIYIDYFKVGNIERTSFSEPGGYTNTGMSTTVVAGTSQLFSFSTGASGKYQKQYYAFYLDINGNGNLENNERLFGVGTAFKTNVIQLNIIIPASASPGLSKLRVIMMPTASMSPNPALSPGVEIEDYNLFILPPQSSKTITNPNLESNPESFELYPNPTTGQINIVGTIGKNNTISIITSSGEVLSKSVKSEDQNAQLDLSQFPSGMYFIKIEDGIHPPVLKKVLKQ